MFASITCPACRHKYTIPEGAMGSRQNCPNCRTPFLAGKSVAEAAAPDVPMKFEPAPAAGINKTMLGETGPPIQYNCPRCKKPLESPAAEAGTKKPCPSCGQRLQVPAPPPTPPGLNKTMLASNGGNAPATGITPGAPATLPMGAVVGAPAAAAPAAAPGFSKRLALVAGVLAGGILLLLCTCLILAIFAGPSQAERDKLAAQLKQYESAQKELQDLKRDMQMKEALAAQEKVMQAKFDQMIATFKAKQDDIERQAALDRERYQNDQQKAAQVKAEADKRQREIDEKKAQALAEEQKSKDNLAKLQSELDALKNRQQQAQTVVAQPPPVVYSYPYYHPYRYWPWW